MSKRWGLLTSMAGVVSVACTTIIEVVPPPPPLPSCVARPTGMLHFWPGDGSGRDVVGGADAQVLDGATFTPGFVSSGSGQAFLFDGVDANARVSDRPSLNPTTAFTLMAWARLDSNAAFTGPVAGKAEHVSEGFAIDHHLGVWRGFVRHSSGATIRLNGPPFTLGEWTHLALTWNGQTGRLYVAGEVAVALPSPFVTLPPIPTFFGIGYRSEAGFTDAELDFEFDGAVDEVGFFDRALTSSEIADVFEAGEDVICKT